LREWDVIHQEGHVEARKTDKSTYVEYRGNTCRERVEADIVAGNARLGAKQDEEVWEGKVSSWNILKGRGAK
jgi:hypothetical protein